MQKTNKNDIKNRLNNRKGILYMKILKRLGMIATSLFISMKTLALKVYAVSIDNMHMQTDYGVVKIEPKSTRIINIALTIIIPVILLIGIIIYCVKSKVFFQIFVCRSRITVFMLPLRREIKRQNV